MRGHAVAVNSQAFALSEFADEGQRFNRRVYLKDGHRPTLASFKRVLRKIGTYIVGTSHFDDGLIIELLLQQRAHTSSVSTSFALLHRFTDEEANQSLISGFIFFDLAGMRVEHRLNNG